MTQSLSIEYRRAGWFTLSLLLINGVADGYSGRPSPLVHQLLLLPATVMFLWSLWQFLNVRGDAPDGTVRALWTPRRALFLALLFELAFFGVYFYECHHFAPFGYMFRPKLAAALFLPAIALLLLAATRRSVSALLAMTAAVAAYLAGMVVAVASFPLTYLRSDMLAVIFWADQNLLRHVDPYKTVYIGGRVYDFPYLPGMMLAYAPFVAAHADIRLGCVAYVLASAALILFAARRQYRIETAALLATLLLCPFLQFRHELYTQPHWFTLVLVLVLMQRRRFAMAALAFGASMAIYQFSWVIFPFFLLQAFRRRGWMEASKLALLAAVAALVIDGPFLASALHRVASNTVSQWSLLPHAVAEPINLSYWATYLVAPAHLQRLQAVLMAGIFAYCVFKKRCLTTADTVRWMVAALSVFLLFNVIIDGYFYLTLLVLMLGYTCIANQWWTDPEIAVEG